MAFENSDPVIISIIIPIKDEEENVFQLYKEIIEVFPNNCEIIFVDDNSKDNSFSIINQLVFKDCKVKVLRQYNAYGKDEALLAGMNIAEGTVIATLDGDLQNNPADIPGMLKQLPGFDMVCGIRSNRADSILKKMASKIANMSRNIITKDDIIDAGCAIRVFRRECIMPINKYSKGLFGMAHCFYPTILKIEGFKIKQVIVSHRYRINGKSKFGVIRERVFTGAIACAKVRKLKKCK